MLQTSDPQASRLACFFFMPTKAFRPHVWWKLLVHGMAREWDTRQNKSRCFHRLELLKFVCKTVFQICLQKLFFKFVCKTICSRLFAKLLVDVCLQKLFYKSFKLCLLVGINHVAVCPQAVAFFVISTVNNFYYALRIGVATERAKHCLEGIKSLWPVIPSWK